jgi:hypothetical protein
MLRFRFFPVFVAIVRAARLGEFSPDGAIDCFVQLLENNRSGPHFRAAFFHDLVYALIVTKIGLG